MQSAATTTKQSKFFKFNDRLTTLDNRRLDLQNIYSDTVVGWLVNGVSGGGGNNNTM